MSRQKTFAKHVQNIAKHPPQNTAKHCFLPADADKPWDVVSVTRRSSGVAPRACVRVYARVLVPPNLYTHTYMNTYCFSKNTRKTPQNTHKTPAKHRKTPQNTTKHICC